jgi:hypothetical protein
MTKIMIMRLTCQKELRKSLGLVVLFIGTAMVPTVSYAQFGSLKGLVKKAKEKAQETVGNSTESISGVTEGVSSATRGTAPWPMQSSTPVYNGKSTEKFLLGITEESDEYLVALRDQMYARFKTNAKLAQASDMNAMNENQNLTRFYYAIFNIINCNVFNVSAIGGKIDARDAHYLITSNKGSGIGYFVTDKGGKFQFVTQKDDGAFLNGEELATAKQAAARMRKLQILTTGLNEMYQSAGEDCDRGLQTMNEYCGLYADAVEKACANNTPENIERKPRPAAGKMHAQLKAQALQVAKAEDPDVVDVIITSAVWDVKMKGLVPLLRNVYGYYVVKDAQGLMCLSRAWTEDYLGDGKYGKMRPGGVGVGSPFYIK